MFFLPQHRSEGPFAMEATKWKDYIFQRFGDKSQFRIEVESENWCFIIQSADSTIKSHLEFQLDDYGMDEIFAGSELTGWELKYGLGAFSAAKVSRFEALIDPIVRTGWTERRYYRGNKWYKTEIFFDPKAATADYTIHLEYFPPIHKVLSFFQKLPMKTEDIFIEPIQPKRPMSN